MRESVAPPSHVTPALSPAETRGKLSLPAGTAIHRSNGIFMTTRTLLSRSTLAATLLLSSSGSAQQPPADLVFKNATIYTANDRSPRAEAVAAKADKIVFVGNNSGAARLIGPSTKVVDLKGATLLPGLTDAHVHLSGVGQR